MTKLAADSTVDRLPLTDQLLWYVNEARRQSGLGSVVWSRQLSKAAQLHSDDLAVNHLTGHMGSDGSMPPDRWERSNYQNGFYVAEATAWGFNSARGAVNFWLTSPDHRGIVLHPQATEIGVAQSTNYDAPHAWYWVTEFASDSLPADVEIFDTRFLQDITNE